ncbi:MAG TPA: ATP-binding protein [Verrucomicrobiae bacterium]|jgi:PAS domain S-box-containing protein|nr:ATP-binding protein [Verrucomicrobiae bacterium]
MKIQMMHNADEMEAEIARLKTELARENAARLEAQAIAKRAVQHLNDNHQGQELLQAITVAANQAASVVEAMQIALDQICGYTSWPIGHVYLTAEDGSVDLVPLDVWHGEQTRMFEDFRRATQASRLTKGMGLAGRVFKTGKAVWVKNIQEEESLAKAGEVKALELISAFAFPLVIGPGVAGVLEFFSRVEHEPDTRLLKIMSQVGAQLGRVIEREQAAAKLQHTEAYFRKLTENALDLITILSADGTIQFESHSIYSVLGFAPEEYRGKNAFEFVHPDDVQIVEKAFVEALKTNGDTERLTFRFRHKDGTYRTLEGMGQNLLDDTDVAGIIFNSRDVTERKRLEQQFLQAQKVQAIGQLAAGVAHDFNNILTAIIGYSDMVLLRMEPSHPSHSHMTGVKQAAYRAAALTRQLLAFGRKQMLQPMVVSLNLSISEMEKMLRRLLGEDIILVTNPGENLGRVKADLSQIEQVILNLAVNARDAMPKGGRLTIETANVTLDEKYAEMRSEVAPGEYVMLAVSDNGSGMTPDVRARLFEPFFTTKEQGKGTGLGLATCHGIVKQSGGHIAVYSEVGQGTTFKVYLPRVDAVEETKAKSETIKLRRTGTETVLLVEDEPMVRELGVAYLTQLGYTVFSASNGRQAMNLLHANKNRKIDILVTDVVMPEMGGKELADYVHNISADTKVLFCSGYTEEAMNLRGTLGKDREFLTKPYTIDALALKVRELLDKK